MSRRLQLALALVLAPLLAVSCATVSPQDVELVNRAKTIRKYPISRNALVKKLELQPIKSERIGGSVRGGNMLFTESWTFPNGTEVTGWDSEYVGNEKLIPADIDALLAKSEKVVTKAEIDALIAKYDDPSGPPGDFIHPIGTEFYLRPRKTFNSVVITSARGKMLFNSNNPS